MHSRCDLGQRSCREHANAPVSRYMNVRGRTEEQRAARRVQMAQSLGREKQEREDKVSMYGVGASLDVLAAFLIIPLSCQVQAPRHSRAHPSGNRSVHAEA